MITMAQEQTRYMNPMTDFGFKKIFGDKEVMTDGKKRTASP